MLRLPISGRNPLRLPVAVVLAVTAGCSNPDVPAWLAVAEEIPAPAGPGSGEPFVAADGEGVVMSWLERNGEGHDLRFSRYDGSSWSAPVTITHSTDFFVNWADFPSVRPGPEGTLWAHWLERGAAGGYDYGVRIVRSADGGRTWSEPWTPHDDGTPTEHGFVSAFAEGSTITFAWLDGRKNDPDALAAAGGHGGEMTLRARAITVGGSGRDATPGEEVLLDGRVCDCCQTAATLTDEGPIVIYRNRTEDEIRDIYVTRRVDGAWSEGVPVHDDGWEIGGCPVNGPAIAASGRSVAVAWFTAPNDVARAKVAFSSDAGATFADPVVVDDGNPAGRVDVVMLDDGSALVTWLERIGGEGAEVRMRIVEPDGGAGTSVSVSATTSTRPSGFPRIAALPGGDLVAAWTDARGEEPVVRTAVIELARQ